MNYPASQNASQGVARWSGIRWRLPPELGGDFKRNTHSANSSDSFEMDCPFTGVSSLSSMYVIEMLYLWLFMESSVLNKMFIVQHEQRTAWATAIAAEQAQDAPVLHPRSSYCGLFRGCQWSKYKYQAAA